MQYRNYPQNNRKREPITGRRSAPTGIKARRLTWLILAGSAAFSFAGEALPAPPPAPASPSGNWCESLQSAGTLYKNPENPWIQEFKINGRFQYQYSYVDGKSGPGGNFHYDTDEIRRFYAGTGVTFLHWFEFAAQANIFRDRQSSGRDSRTFAFEHMWDMFLKFDAHEALGWDAFDEFKFGYGKREVNMSEEWNVSSKFIKTVERSAISNKIWPHDLEFTNATGAWIEGRNGPLSWTLGAFTTSQSDWIAPWDDGQLYYSRFLYDFAERTGAEVSQVLWTMFYQNLDAGDQALAGGVEWASSLSLRYGRGPWTIRVEGIVGDNGDTNASGTPKAANQRGSFWGVVVTPSRWLIENRLEAVARYQFQAAAEPRGIRLYSRYVRRADVDSPLALVNSGRGDRHHSVYAGLNYYLCDNNLKLMAGLQYDDISSAGTDVYSGLTTFLALRTYF